jgi:ubiquinone/menaquinone biosynthesis C-methylase UbiE
LVYNPSFIPKFLAEYIRSKGKLDTTAIFWKFKVGYHHLYLDAGCGSQTWTLETWHKYSKSGVEIIALDINLQSLKTLRKHIKDEGINVSLVLGDLEHLPFRQGIFDRVKCTEVIEHVTNDLLAVTEISRVSKRSGLLLLSVPTSISERLISSLSN